MKTDYEKINQAVEIVSEGKNGQAQAEAKKQFDKVKDIAVEHAMIVKEDFKKVLVIPAELGWSDIGNWGTLLDVLAETHGSTIISRGYHIDMGSEGCLVYGNEKMIATLGLKDVIVIDTPDVFFVANRHNAQNVKDLLDKLKVEGKHLYL